MPLNTKFNCQTIGCKIGFTVKNILRMLENEFEKSDVRLTIEQYFILNILNSEEGLILKNLAEILDRDKSAVLRHLNSLEENQFVARSTDPDDKRRKILFITKPGLRTLTKAQELDEKVDRAICSDLSSKELDAFEQTLCSLYKSTLRQLTD